MHACIHTHTDTHTHIHTVYNLNSEPHTHSTCRHRIIITSSIHTQVVQCLPLAADSPLYHSALPPPPACMLSSQFLCLKRYPFTQPTYEADIKKEWLSFTSFYISEMEMRLAGSLLELSINKTLKNK